MLLSGYVEINLICLILLLIIFFRLHQRRTMISMPQRIMQRMTVATMVLCMSDVVAILCRGAFFPGARVVIETSNLIYMSAMPVISLLWAGYVHNRLGLTLNRTQTWIHRIPLLIFLLVAATNPLHHFLFTINEENLYARGPGVVLHWILSWPYFIHATVLSYRAIRQTTSWTQRNEYKPLLSFILLPAIGCVTQMIFYGITSVQVGVTISLVLLSLQMQDNQVSADELTGINNRKAMRNYVDSVVYNAGAISLTVMMIDVNHFKMINDTFGHAMGDIALCDTADLLKQVCRNSSERLFLCRYGGDEFVIIGRELDKSAVPGIIDLIHQAVEEYAGTEGKPFSLGVSIGHATGLCSDYSDFSHYLRLADENMYEDKKRQG